jgi:hypothetical protein
MDDATTGVGLRLPEHQTAARYFRQLTVHPNLPSVQIHIGLAPTQ